MSTSSGPKRRAQRHQNAFAFRHNNNSKLSNKIQQTVSTHNLCASCARKIEWRVRFRKYKPLSAPKSCNKCRLKTVRAAYRTVCTACAAPTRLCEMCANNNPAPLRAEPHPRFDHPAHVMRFVDTLSERHRRTVLRLIHRGVPLTQAMSNIGVTVAHNLPPPAAPPPSPPPSPRASSQQQPVQHQYANHHGHTPHEAEQPSASHTQATATS